MTKAPVSVKNTSSDTIPWGFSFRLQYERGKPLKVTKLRVRQRKTSGTQHA